jgi:replication factor C subunit 2/4
MDFFTSIKTIDTDINIKLPWIEKYRPKNAEEILLEPFIKQKIEKILEQRSIPNMIITGEPGTGKTSTILFLAKQIYGSSYDENVLELNASDDRGLSIINNTIYPFCKKKNSGDIHKLVILDEADSITHKAQNLLSNIISEFRKNTRIVFICNDCSQIIESIQSRCIIVKYPKINSENLYQKIKNICISESIEYDDKGINTLLFYSDYDIRHAINNLECIYYSFDKLNELNVYRLIDKPKPHYISELLKYCFENNYVKAINIVKELYNNGYTPNDILLSFMKFLFENEEPHIKSEQSNILIEQIKINEEIKLSIYEIISLSYIRVNGGIDTLLQLCGCISKIFIYLQSN